MINILQRAIIEISGNESKKFLQGLITNDINKISANNLIYSGMLNARGAFLYDFFIFQKDEKILIDCAANEIDEIVKKLNFYKLKAQVEIKKNEDLLIAQSLENIGFADARCKNLGFRIYATKEELEEVKDKLIPLNQYHYLRIKNKIAEGEFDLIKEKSFILEFGFNELNAVDYNKGCYVGQELTARTHHLGQVRKKIFYATLENNENYNQENIGFLKGLEIKCEGEKIGNILSAIFYEGKIHALALIRLENYEARKSENFQVNNFKLSIIN
jgi:folate-binding protein YgfZ